MTTRQRITNQLLRFNEEFNKLKDKAEELKTDIYHNVDEDDIGDYDQVIETIEDLINFDFEDCIF